MWKDSITLFSVTSMKTNLQQEKHRFKQTQKAMRWKCCLPEVCRSWTQVHAVLLAQGCPSGGCRRSHAGPDQAPQPSPSMWKQVCPWGIRATSFTFNQLESPLQFSLRVLCPLILRPQLRNKGLRTRAFVFRVTFITGLCPEGCSCSTKTLRPKDVRVVGLTDRRCGNSNFEFPDSAVKPEIAFH